GEPAVCRAGWYLVRNKDLPIVCCRRPPLGTNVDGQRCSASLHSVSGPDISKLETRHSLQRGTLAGQRSSRRDGIPLVLLRPVFVRFRGVQRIL
ncbi:MAG: hypothetical protein AVDCRST_MAG83-1555, partial [uncultured Arthrobacter sp.]